MSVDYGTQNAFAALLWCRDREGTWHAVREFYFSGRAEGHQRTDQDYCRDLVDLCEGLPRPMEVIVDPSATSFIAALRRHLNGDGHQLFRVRHARNEVEDGIRDTATCLQTGRVRVSRDLPFWSSGILTGNQTRAEEQSVGAEFWSSGILTGNQTAATSSATSCEF